jgi:hypothetical protein
VKGEAIPKQVRQIEEAFNTVLAYRNPLLPIVYENYMTLRNLLDFLKQWIDERVEYIATGRTATPEKTIALVLAEKIPTTVSIQQKGYRFRVFSQFRSVQPVR